MHDLLKDFKKIASKVIIVEDALEKKRSPRSFLQRCVNYLAARDFFSPIEMFTFDEFSSLMKQHNFKTIRHEGQYIVGLYQKNEQ